MKQYYSDYLQDSSQIKNEFQIVTFNPDSREQAIIPTKKSVKYLGMNLNYLIRCHAHIDGQITKARNAFKALARLFFDSRINSRARTICYLLLIRPILTYACPIWWTLGAAQTEKIRKFERACIRATLTLYRCRGQSRESRITKKRVKRISVLGNSFELVDERVCDFS